MPLLGASALLDLVLPTGIDGNKILQWNLEDGTSSTEVLARAATAVGVANQEIMQEFGEVVYLTEESYALYSNGVADTGMTPKKTEFTQPSGVRTAETGHMLPRVDYEDALAWTKHYLRRARLGKIDADLRLIVDRWKNRVRFDVHTRMMSNLENLIGTGGYDVPFAIGTGMNVNYIPPQSGAKKFTSAHTHFVYADTSSSGTFATLFDSMMGELRHHGGDYARGNILILVSGDDLDTIAAITGFVELNPTNVTVVAGNTAAPVRITGGNFEFVPGSLFGYYKSKKYGLAELRYDDYMPTGFAFATRPFGMNNPMNALAIRQEPGIGFGLKPDPRVTNSLNPELEKILFEATHGVGVNNRLNGVAGKIGAGVSSYAAPTLSDSEARAK